jgi:membrane-bound metal-dependent hydrolase YbcI (DUF457 family)
MNPHLIIALIHVFLIAPALITAALFRSQNPDWVYQALFITGIVVLLYHGYKAVVKIMGNYSGAWVNIIHVLLFAPLLIYIGVQQKNTPRAAYELLAMAGFAALGYHLYSIITMLHLNYDMD